MLKRLFCIVFVISRVCTCACLPACVCACACARVCAHIACIITWINRCLRILKFIGLIFNTLATLFNLFYYLSCIALFFRYIFAVLKTKRKTIKHNLTHKQKHHEHFKNLHRPTN